LRAASTEAKQGSTISRWLWIGTTTSTAAAPDVIVEGT
jgi:hypothetical protein